MKLISAALQNFLLVNTTFNRAYLISITLPNGQVINVVDGPGVDITYGGVTYYCSRYGAWERGAFKNTAQFRMTATSMDLKAIIPESLMYPGTSTPFMQAINLGGLIKALVSIQTLYWPIGQPYTTGVSMGTMMLNAGQIGNVKPTGRSNVISQVFDYTYTLARPCPPHQIQTSCRHNLFDASCTLLASAFASTGLTLATGSTNLSLIVNGFNPTFPITLGYIVFTAGQNTGWMASIKAASTVSGDTTISVLKPLRFPVAAGDVITVYPGCDKSLEMCAVVYDNLIHIGSMPFVPNPEIAA